MGKASESKESSEVETVPAKKAKKAADSSSESSSLSSEDDKRPAKKSAPGKKPAKDDSSSEEDSSSSSESSSEEEAPKMEKGKGKATVKPASNDDSFSDESSDESSDEARKEGSSDASYSSSSEHEEKPRAKATKAAAKKTDSSDESGVESDGELSSSEEVNPAAWKAEKLTDDADSDSEDEEKKRAATRKESGKRKREEAVTPSFKKAKTDDFSEDKRVFGATEDDVREVKIEGVEDEIKQVKDEISQVKDDFNQVKDEINQVLGQIQTFEAQISAVTMQLQEGPPRGQVKYLREKERQLRSEMVRLCDKEQQLRSEKVLFLEKERLLLVRLSEKEAQLRVPGAQDRGAILEHANRMYASIAEPKILELANGMRVMRDVYLLPGSAPYDLVIRPVAAAFWKACVDTTDSVCAVGAPGIGKSMSIPFLIYLLLTREEKQKVVFLRVTHKMMGWYVEFDPSKSANNVRVYPEDRPRQVDSLNDPTTTLIIDPGPTKESCLHSGQARLIIVASPDARHWGHNEFGKWRRGESRWVGTFLYYPFWTLGELQEAAPYCVEELREKQEEAVKKQEHAEDLSRQLKATEPGGDLSQRLRLQLEQARMEADEASGEAQLSIKNWRETELKNRYREFGGIPRAVFADDTQLANSRKRVEFAVKTFSRKSHFRMLLDTVKPGSLQMDTGDPDLPSGSVIGYERINPEVDDFSSDNTQLVVLSDFVREEAFKAGGRELWNAMLSKPSIQSHGLGFEEYVFLWLCKPGTAKRTLSVRKLAGGTGWDGERRLDLTKLTASPPVYEKSLAAYVVSEHGQAGVLYRSAMPMHALFDFMFVRDNTFYAINATVGFQHSCKLKQIDAVLKAIKGSKLVLIYAVPEERLERFRTDPPHPFQGAESSELRSYYESQCEILAVGVSPPAVENEEAENPEGEGVDVGDKRS